MSRMNIMSELLGTLIDHLLCLYNNNKIVYLQKINEYTTLYSPIPEITAVGDKRDVHSEINSIKQDLQAGELIITL